MNLWLIKESFVSPERGGEGLFFGEFLHFVFGNLSVSIFYAISVSYLR